MLIESVLDEAIAKEGTRAVLVLVDPRAHGGKGKGGVNKSNKAWNFSHGQ
jgi:hypothetical protein